MTPASTISTAIRSAFCVPIDIAPVPIGFAVTTGFMLPDGDPLSFYVVSHDNGTFTLRDDGLTLPNAIAGGVDLKSSVRESLLRGILESEGVGYDGDMSLRTDPLMPDALAGAVLRFVSALIRTQDLFLLSRENVAASFAEDVRRELERTLPPAFLLEEDPPGLRDTTAPDLILRSRTTGLIAARVYAAGSDLHLMDAILSHSESREGEAPIVAVADRRRGRVSDRRLNAAINRGLPIAVVSGDGEPWTDRVFAIASAGAEAARQFH